MMLNIPIGLMVSKSLNSPQNKTNNIPYFFLLAIGWTITCFGVLQLPIWIVVGAIRAPGATWIEKLRNSFKPKHDWGPTDPLLREQYNKEIANDSIANEGLCCWGYIKKNIFG